MIKNSKILILLLLFSFSSSFNRLSSQNNTIDSLKLVLKSSKQDTTKVIILNKLSEEFDIAMDIDNAIKYGNDALSFAKKINFQTGVTKALDNLGNAFSDKGDNAEALNYYSTSLSIKKGLGNKKEMAYTYNLLGNIAKNYDEALKNYLEALMLNAKVGYKEGMGKNYNNVGLVYLNKGDFVKALDNFFYALDINKKLGDKKWTALVYRNIGVVYEKEGNYSEALNNQLEALKINEELGDKNGLLSNYNNIGIVYYFQLNYNEALKYYFLALKLSDETGDKYSIANAYINIGTVYFEQKNYNEAIKYQFSSLKINEELDNKTGIALNYNNIGDIYKTQGNYSEALKNHFSSLKLNEELEDKKEIAHNYINIGEIYSKQKKYDEAKKYLEMGLNLSKEIGNKERIKDSYNSISLMDSSLSNWKSAYDNNKLFYAYKDSLTNEVINKKLVQTQMQYDFDKKETQTKAEQEKRNVIIAEEKQRQKIITIAISIGLMIVLIFSVLLFNRFKLTLKQKRVIEIQKKQVEVQKLLVEEKNKQVTDSINYAKRIHTALMPSDKTVREKLPNSFIIYFPKDIVAGDFYWMETVQFDNLKMSQLENEEKQPAEFSNFQIDKFSNQIILFAACDCTGHGVPGALVSVVCNNALNRAVREFNLIEPAAILDKTEEIVTENFSKNDLGIRDGMDISLCSLDRVNRTLQYSGANNPLWIVKKIINLENLELGTLDLELFNFELIETKADKQPIGINENNKPFTNHTFQLQKNDTVYIFSDGFADQFGGETGRKKLTRKRFKDLILSVQHLSMDEQKSAIETFFFDYKRDIEQIDDVLIIGVRV